MTSRVNGNAAVATTATRCAIYTRKSTDEGLAQDFNSLDAQREACEAYVASQRHEGWEVLDAHYDDGGYTGANIERPALKQLLQDVEAGLVDAVVVYKIDRISRSLMDFARLMDLFEKRNVALVSVTQQFSTGNSMGRLEERKRQQLDALAAEKKTVTMQLRSLRDEQRGIIRALENHEISGVTARLNEIETHLAALTRREEAITEESRRLEDEALSPADLRTLLERFDPVWDVLTPGEKWRVLQLLVERVTYDGEADQLSMTLSPTGIQTLHHEQERYLHE